MEKLKHIKPTKQYENQALNYIEEFYQYNSNINGAGKLDDYLDNYNEWLLYLESLRNISPTEEKVPTETFFLVRESDNKIVGMINIRLALNEKLKKAGGHIGYSIRPTEREKGYNKINLYLGLLLCRENGIKEVFMDCDKNNIASAKTIKALGGILVKEYLNDKNNYIQDYIINVNDSINKYKNIYEPSISSKLLR